MRCYQPHDGNAQHTHRQEGFDVVLSLVGNALLRLQPAMIEAAHQAGVTHFYLGEWNSDIDQPEIAGMRYFRDKQAARAHAHAVAKADKKGW